MLKKCVLLNILPAFLRLSATMESSKALLTSNAICRKSDVYPEERQVVPDDKVPWNVTWTEYSPPTFSAPHLSKAVWADPDINDKSFKPKWNDQDSDIDRRSYSKEGTIEYIVERGYPRNPAGRTGLSGRGRLGRWGPNHAGDALISRWKRCNESGEKQLDAETGLPIVQFIAILRSDCRKWAIPGGFVDPKETSSDAVLRELFEEAVNASKLAEETQLAFKNFLKNGNMVYRGYVDDPRNTDNAWIETTAINFHDETGKETGDITLDARDDAVDSTWVDITKDMDIYPPHHAIIAHLVNSLKSSS